MYSLYTDGSAIPNPGPCGCGAVLIDESENVLWTLSEYLGLGTNNVGEMTAILRGCQHFVSLELDGDLTIYSDSELSVNLINGIKKTKKEHLAKILERILEVKQKRPFKIEWVKAHANVKWNEFADKLADLAVTGAKLDTVQAQATTNEVAGDKIYIKTSFAEKDKVKALGARWDPAKKSWWVQDTPDNQATFSKWIQNA
jgi:ribonuclease HI